MSSDESQSVGRDVRVTLRMPDFIHETLLQTAKKNGKSINSQIVEILMLSRFQESKDLLTSFSYLEAVVKRVSENVMQAVNREQIVITALQRGEPVADILAEWERLRAEETRPMPEDAKLAD